jgi:hypothetical protein
VTATRGPCLPWDGSIYCCNLSAESPITTGDAMMAATEVLYNLTGQIFDVCEFTIRPCRENCDDGWWWGGLGGWGAGYAAGSRGGLGVWPLPALIGGNWYNLTCGGCSGTCSCTPLCEAIMPSPVHSIISVKLDGQTLPASGYRVDDFRKLVRLGGDCWPVCQDLTLDDDQPNTWSVTLQVGEDVPTIGKLAVGQLACEIRRSCIDDCAIPRTASAITRQGITIDLVTITELLRNGLTGLHWVDMFISISNPRRLLAPPLVFDVDGERYRRTNT